ncbi:MAG: Smr/MutS family protein, partial [Deferribacterota bacterium]|nr:Smr/MutS family protein [Deferribacterota bacterium]
DNKKIYIDKRDLKGVKINDNNEKINIITKEFTKEKNELNLVGKTVEEALEELDNFISVMLLNNVEVFYIIHGRGTGKLKKGVHEYLKNNKYVKSYRIANADEGGEAVTIVEI